MIKANIVYDLPSPNKTAIPSLVNIEIVRHTINTDAGHHACRSYAKTIATKTVIHPVIDLTTLPNVHTSLKQTTGSYKRLINRGGGNFMLVKPDIS